MTIGYQVVLVGVTPAATGAPYFIEAAGITPTRLTWRQELSDCGLLTVTTQVGAIEAAGTARLKDLSLTPCELWLYRSDDSSGAVVATRVHAGPVIGRRIVGREITLTAPGLLYYLKYWRQLTDVSFAAVDQTQIVKSLVDTWQAQAYAHDGIDTSTLAASGVPQTISYVGAEAKPIFQIVTELGRRTAGFDVSVDPVTRGIIAWSPQRGTDRSASVFLDFRSIGQVDISASVAADIVASELVLSTSTAGTGALASTVSNTALRATFGRAATSVQIDGISDASALASAASTVLTDFGTQQISLAPALLPVTGLDPVSIAPGDTVQYSYDAGLGLEEFKPRIATIETTFEGRELMKLGFV